MLLIVNPNATTVSSRLRNLVVYALRGRYDVEAVETEAQGHAIALTREAVRERYDLVVAFGGDGTVNEAANGLAGSDVPLSPLPGGCTNVFCRTLGVPSDVVDATEHLLTLADDPRVRRVDLGRVNGRHFVFSSGAGIDADTTRWVDERSRLKLHAGPLVFAGAALMSFYRAHASRQASVVVEAGDERIEGITAVVQSSDPYTYFNSRPLHVCAGARLDDGALSVAVLKRARQRDLPGLVSRLLLGAGPVTDHPALASFSGLDRVRISAAGQDGREPRFPLQVDGDHIGDFREALFEITPASLSVVA